MTTIILFIVLILLYVLLNVVFGFLERYLVRKKRSYGMILPAFFFIISVMTMMTSLEQSVSEILSVDAPVVAVLVIIGVFVFINIPTIVTYIIYRRVLKGMDEKKD